MTTAPGLTQQLPHRLVLRHQINWGTFIIVRAKCWNVGSLSQSKENPPTDCQDKNFNPESRASAKSHTGGREGFSTSQIAAYEHGKDS
ncbi:hypothetical protein TWF102_009937 [Orbilia oligospora]|uniref:Uncharacterized protein n=1 Tax=Orbilia oligospora TaxID=2813651 RepID=A0A7C8N9K2_ORBOL|nr:hypothetical protein TWF706_005100 [Orbilia oligospora]KAF3103236.1 hypothetical protein TWF103_007235 [Orbilia oligospora]KAF3109164.1 hypothetical protein TWF102_009937 [Orbilia oligospora]